MQTGVKVTLPEILDIHDGRVVPKQNNNRFFYAINNKGNQIQTGGPGGPGVPCKGYCC